MTRFVDSTTYCRIHASSTENHSGMESKVIVFLNISIINLEQPKRSLARKVVKLMPLSINPIFGMEKLKKQASPEIGRLHLRRASVDSTIQSKFSTLRSLGAASRDIRSSDEDFQ